MRSYYDTVYLSPHLDDVVLSCGGQIFEQTAAGRSVLVVTVIAGDPPPTAVSNFAQRLHQQWQTTTNVVATRRGEDVAACRLLQADHCHWPLLDAIYRAHPFTQMPLYASTEALVGPIHPLETGLVAAVARRLQSLPAHGRLLVPLAAGHHVDHQLTRLAAEHCFGRCLRYYEDYPYVQMPGMLDEALEVKETWQSEVIPLSQKAVGAKLEAIAAYASQIKALFSDWAHLERLLHGYMEQMGGERLWQPATA